jgi:hypothetical protein
VNAPRSDGFATPPVFKRKPALALEDDYEDTLVAGARALGYLVHVERKANTARGYRTPIKGNRGWPDVVIAGHGRLIVAELKRPGNKPTPEQLAWLVELRIAGVDARLVLVPDELDALLEELARR